MKKMTIYSEARLRGIEKDQHLCDRRALFFDEIGISINLLIRLETDLSYIPHPSVSAKLITYFRDTILAKDVCRNCLITKTKLNTSLKKKSNMRSGNDLVNFVPSQYNQSYQKKIRSIRRELTCKDSQKTFYYFARLEAALSNLDLINRYNVQILTGNSHDILMKVENDKSYVPRVEVSNDLLKLYKCEKFANQICQNCPVRRSYNQLKKEDKAKNDKKNEKED